MKLVLAFCLLAFPALSFSQELGPEELVKKVTAEVLDAVKSDKELASGIREKAL
jgi:hypothetical protein